MLFSAAVDYLDAMRLRPLRPTTFLAVAVAFTPLVIRATSPPADYLPPSQYESVKEASDVVVAVLDRVDPAERGWKAEFHITRSLKGKAPALRPVVLVDRQGELAPDQTRVLFMWQPTDRGGPPLSRLPPTPTTAPIITALSDRRADPAWVETLERYAEIAALDNYDKEKMALRQLQRSAKEHPEQFPSGIADDIELHFKTPSPEKSFEDLAELHRLAAPGQERDKVLNAMAQALHPQAFELIEPHLRHPVLRLRFLDYMAKVDSPRSKVVLLRELVGTADRMEREALARALAERATKADAATMLQALRACDGDDVAGRIIAGWFVRNPTPEAAALMKEMMGPDYRDNTAFLFGLAKLGDEDVVRWAEQGVLEPQEDGIRVSAVSVLAYSPTDSADTLIREMIARADMEHLPLLVYGLADDNEPHSNPRWWERLREIAALPGKSNNLRAALEQKLRNSQWPEAKHLLSVMDATSRPSTSEAPSAANGRRP